MIKNTQILTFDLFKRLCSSYEKALEYYKSHNVSKEDNLNTFASFIKKSFDRFNIAWDGTDYSTLYTLYLYIKDKLDVDFTNTAETASSYYKFLEVSQAANLDLIESSSSFSAFIGETTSSYMSANSRKAMYSLFKLASTNRKLTINEQKNLLKSVTDKKNNLNLRKMHGMRDFLIKKGGTLLTIAIGVFAGAAIATATLPAGGLIAASPINNIITFGITGAFAGGALAYAGIKVKNALTKLHYRKKYRSTEYDFERLEEGDIKIDDLKINNLIEKTRLANAEILRLKQPLPEAKGLGKIKNAFLSFGRKIKRHVINAVNRNRIHTISDELDALNTRINNILSSEVQTDNERFSKVEALQEMRNRIANYRASELVNGLAQSLVSTKRVKIENLDIYAKDLLEGRQRKNKRLVRAKSCEILDDLLTGHATKLAGNNVFGGRVDLDLRQHVALLEEAKVVDNTSEQIISVEDECIASSEIQQEETVELPVENTTVEETIVENSVSETIAEVESQPATQIPVTPKNRILPKTISVIEKDIAVETTMMSLLNNKNVVKHLFDEGFEPDVISILTSELIKRQNPGAGKAKKRIRTTKIYKETEGLEELYTYLGRFNAVENSALLSAEALVEETCTA